MAKSPSYGMNSQALLLGMGEDNLDYHDKSKMPKATLVGHAKGLKLVAKLEGLNPWSKDSKADPSELIKQIYSSEEESVGGDTKPQKDIKVVKKTVNKKVTEKTDAAQGTDDIQSLKSFKGGGDAEGTFYNPREQETAENGTAGEKDLEMQFQKQTLPTVVINLFDQLKEPQP